MNAYEKLDNYKTHMAQIAGMMYACWDSDFFKKELLGNIKKGQIPEGDINFAELTEQEMISLGFAIWNKSYLLIPIWLFRILPKNLELVCPFDDEECVRKVQPVPKEYTVGTADDDIRFGCVAYSLKCNPNGWKWS